MTPNIIELGMLSDELYSKRHDIGRRVYGIWGIAPVITAACGMGGGITPKILVYEESNETK